MGRHPPHRSSAAAPAASRHPWAGTAGTVREVAGGDDLGGRAWDHAEIKALVSRMAAANPLRGAPGIHADLMTLGIEAVECTVSLRQRPVFPAGGHATCSFLLARSP